ncbi:hypothetical protein [Caldisericum sp.]|uniref:hypothetical protein n=1 Tax=Caldisericum sp. TaxID=2499687 RepID=UPI003D0AFF53
MKKLLIVLVVLILLFAFSSPVIGDEGISVSVENTLDVPVFKVFTFKVQKEVLSNAQNFLLLDNGVPLPIYFSEDNDNFTFKVALSIGAKEKKILKLIPQDSSPQIKKDFYIPNFIGTQFIVPRKGRVFIVSYGDSNKVSVLDKKSNNVVFEKELKNLDSVFVDLKDDSVFKVSSTKPIFVEFSTLTPPFDKNSSDDVSAVFGTFFKLYIPKVLFITTTKDTNLKITDTNGNVLVNTQLKANSFYANTKLAQGIYTISSDSPVLIEYGYADDNVFATLYGIDSANVISFGRLGVSSIFDNTTVSVKFDDKTSAFTLDKANDFKYLDILNPNDYMKNNTEYKEVFINFSKPVLIYTYSQYGNVDGEQIPSFNNGTLFRFHTGIVTKIFGERQRRVVVVGTEENTNLNFNGNSFTLTPYTPKIFLFNDSFSKVDITSNKQIAVFDLGIEGNEEIFTTLLPLDLYNPINVALLTNTGSQNNGVDKMNPNNTNSNAVQIFENIKVYFSKILKDVSTFFAGIFTQGNVSTLLDVIKTFFKGIASNILGFLRPISEQIYPYISNYFPGLTVDIVSSIIFGLFVFIIIILIIPKGKKEKIPVVKIEEVKKKPIAFNVKDLEVKENAPIEEIPVKPKEIQEELPKLKTIPVKPPEEVVKEVPKEEIEPTRRIFRPAPPRRADRLTIEKEKIGKPKEEAFKEQKEEVPTKEEFRKEEEKKFEEKEKVELESKAKTGEVSGEVIKPKPEEKSASRYEEVLPMETVSETGKAEKVEKVPTEEIVEKPSVVEEPSVEFEKEVKEEIKEEHEVSFADFAQPNLEEIEKVEESVQEERATKQEETVSKEKIEEKTKKDEFKSTFEELLKKLEEENRKKREEKIEKSLTKEEKSEIEQKPSLDETKRFTKIELKSKYVADASVLRKIYENDNLPQEVRNDLLSKACISASQKSEVAHIVEGRFRITVIGLTTIEERLAEDIAKRVSGKYTTGEAILIAKKLRLTDVVVDDKPKLKNYQGINIYSLEEVI